MPGRVGFVSFPAPPELPGDLWLEAKPRESNLRRPWWDRSPPLSVPIVRSGCSGARSAGAPDSDVTTTRIRAREDFPAAPICPHCGKEIQEIAARRVDSVLGVRFVYYCCDCRKVLGVSHRKGFWMG
jgi:hypothetical protein